MSDDGKLLVEYNVEALIAYVTDAHPWARHLGNLKYGCNTVDTIFRAGGGIEIQVLLAQVA